MYRVQCIVQYIVAKKVFPPKFLSVFLLKVMTKFLYTFVLCAWIVGAVENYQHHCHHYDHDQEWMPLERKTTFKVQLCLSQPESLFVNTQMSTWSKEFVLVSFPPSSPALKTDCQVVQTLQPSY